MGIKLRSKVLSRVDAALEKDRVDGVVEELSDKFA